MLTQDLNQITPLHHASSWGAGKLIFFGEHAVVYGYPAIAVALDRGLQAQVSRCLNSDSHTKLKARLSPRGRLAHLQPSQSKSLLKALNTGLYWAYEQGLTLSGMYEFTIEGTLPFKVGLGSSAALSVASLRSIAQLYGHQFSDTELFEGAMLMERVFHENPSGLDHQVSLQGGALIFQRHTADIAQPHINHTFDFTQRPLSINTPLHLVLSWIPREGSTANAVQGVAARRAKDPQAYETLFQEISAIAISASTAIENGRLHKLGLLFNDNHQRLRALGVSTSALDQSCERLLSLGALGAKLSGAGHGGTSFGLFESEEQSNVAAHSLRTQSHQALALTIPSTPVL